MIWLWVLIWVQLHAQMESSFGMPGDMDVSDLSAMMNTPPESQDSVSDDIQAGYELDEPLLTPAEVELEELLAMDEEKAEFQFKAETSRLMDIIVNSLYSSREIFIRELISNASDALAKHRFNTLRDGHLDEKDQLAIFIEANKEAHTVTIYDTGVGMSKEELINNLGTIAHSGTHAFLETLTEGGDVNVIGQFGVGFYSAFLVADDVLVQSRQANGDEYVWRSQAREAFTVSKVPEPDLNRGTRITLQLKQDAHKFSKVSVLESLIRQHSEFIDFPVFLKKSNDWTHVNPAKPIWNRSKDEVTEEEYNKFFKKLSKDWRPPLKHIVVSGEGDFDFKALLYIPDGKDPNLFGHAADMEGLDNVKVYSRGVSINKQKGVLPPYLSFVKGVVESNDFPLKVDREQLSSSKEMKMISKRLTKKVVDTFSHMMKDDKEGPRLWENYATNLFFGCIGEEYPEVKKKIHNMFRFEHLMPFEDEKEGELILLSDYPAYNADAEDYDRTKDPIFFLWAARPSELRSAPILQFFREKKRDVLLIHGTIADQCVESMREYNGRPLISVERGDVEKYINVEVDEEEELARKRMMELFLKDMTKAIQAGDKKFFDRVEITSKLVDSPAAIFANSFGVTPAQEKHIRNQSWFDEKEMGWRLGRKVLSINPNHPIIKKLFVRHEEVGYTTEFEKGVHALYDYALLTGGHHIDDPVLISSLLKESIAKTLEIDNLLDYSPIDIPIKYYEEPTEPPQEDLPKDEVPEEISVPETSPDAGTELTTSTSESSSPPGITIDDNDHYEALEGDTDIEMNNVLKKNYSDEITEEDEAWLLGAVGGTGQDVTPPPQQDEL